MFSRLLLILVFFISFCSVLVAANPGTEQQQQAGKELYSKYCSQCHGDNGDANTPSTPYYKPWPRDFTTGKYKIRTTATGELPTDQDIFRAIKEGLAFKSTGAYTVMPPWPNLTDDQIMNLVYYLKTFSADFQDPEYNNPKPIEIGSPLSSTPESIERGKAVFSENECVKCHGPQGRGNGRSAPTLEDDIENHIRPADLTKRFTFRGGGSKEDIYRTISTGFNGTPMPAYSDLSVEDRWHLTNYIYSLSDRDVPNYNQPDSPISIVAVKDAIELSDISAAKKLFDTAPAATIPIVGQVIEIGREFYPGINEVVVKAVYNSDDIAIMLQWHDMVADSGNNTPDMEVPRFVAETESEDDDPFGDEEEEDPFADEEDGETFADAVAIQIPVKLEEGFAKPYFVFGDKKRAVHLWHMDLGAQTTKTYLGKGSKSLSEVADSGLSGTAAYDDGVWTAIFKRKRVIENGVSFDKDGAFIPIAFSVWDGFNQERGNKRGLTSWFSLRKEPQDKPSPFGPMLIYGLGLLILELVLIAFVRKKAKAS